MGFEIWLSEDTKSHLSAKRCLLQNIYSIKRDDQPTWWLILIFVTIITRKWTNIAMRSYDRKFYGHLQSAVLISWSHSVSSELDDICFHTWTSVLIITSKSRQVEKMAICCPQGRGTLRQQSLLSHHMVPKLSQICPKVVITFSQNWSKVVAKLFQICLEVVPKMSRSCPKGI